MIVYIIYKGLNMTKSLRMVKSLANFCLKVEIFKLLFFKIDFNILFDDFDVYFSLHFCANDNYKQNHRLIT